MAVLRHFACKSSPLKLLRYIMGETKKEKAAAVESIMCSEDAYSAYQEMKLNYECYANEPFHSDPNGTGKQHIRMHHYVISFKGKEVTPEEAVSVAKEWALKVFRSDHQILIAAHADTKNIHVHLAVNAINVDGKRWLDNKKTVKLCRDEINRLCKGYRLDVIEEPKYNARQSYTEWLARKNGTSWKTQLCDDIDRIVSLDSVHSVDDLVKKLKQTGYEVKYGKYLSVKPKNVKNKPVRTFRLGYGYSMELLQFRIENKDKEMTYDKILEYSGEQRYCALCYRYMQMQAFRNDTQQKNDDQVYRDIIRNLELLSYLTTNNIRGRAEFEKKVNEAAEEYEAIKNRIKELEAEIREYAGTYKAYEKNKDERYKKYHDVYEADMKELAEAKEKLIAAESNKKQMTIHYMTMRNALHQVYGYTMQDEKAAFDEYVKQVEEKKAAEAEKARLEEERKQAEKERAAQRELERVRAEERRKNAYNHYRSGDAR